MSLSLSDAILLTPPPSERIQRGIWRKLGWEPHPLQLDVMLSQARNRVFSAGRRTGKSQVGGMLLVPEVFRAMAEMEMLEQLQQRREYWIVGPEYSDAEKEFRVFYNAFTRLGIPVDKPGTYNNPESGQMRVQALGGRFIVHAKSAKYPETLVGEGLSGVVFSEAAKLKPSVWLKYIRPTLADFRGWSYWGSTPEGRNHFYERWEAGQDPDRRDWASWRAPSWSNPYVYRAGVNEGAMQFLTEMRKDGKDKLRKNHNQIKAARALIDPEILAMFDDMSMELFNQEVAALFTEYVGRVFKDFDETYHVTDDEYRPEWKTYACADYGFTNPFVFLVLQVDPHGERVHVLEEYYETGRTTEEACREIQARGLTRYPIAGFFPDPAEPDRTREIQQRLKLRPLSPGSLEIKDRIEWIRRKLKFYPAHLPMDHPERVPWLTFNRRCINAKREMDVYRYKETAEQAHEKGRSAPENPMKMNDHVPEALGRFMSGFFGKPYASSQARQSKVNHRR